MRPMKPNSILMSNLIVGIAILIACGAAWVINDLQLRGIRRDLEVKPADVLRQVKLIQADLEVKPADVLRAVEDLARLVQQQQEENEVLREQIENGPD